ncbi:hypothetical protein JUN65_20200 [Gluconacetobacter azotocaptans]|uniref:hypothetical protein n=1 Tax=Gluconacetobacter azotocaptans TaxID=142834 RepID=UPI00195770EC|nr:hypothetical protein [Gluconacetobacter azotocaptans]MBM9403881.1 hypothetical protein [Gluconacetobacter azotocaptans]
MNQLLFSYRCVHVMAARGLFFGKQFEEQNKGVATLFLRNKETIKVFYFNQKQNNSI